MKDIKSHEKRILGYIVKKNALYDDIGLTTDDFTDRNYKLIFSAISKIVESGNEANDLTIFEKVKESGNVPIEFITSLTENISTTANIKYHTDILKESSYKRKLHKLSVRIQDLLKAKNTGQYIADQIDQELTAIIDNTQTGRIKKISELIPDALNRIEYAVHHKGMLSGLSTGFPKLDFMTGGLQNGDMIVIASRTSIGKTAMALCMASNMAIQKIEPIGLFSSEMSDKLIVDRLIAINGRLPLTNMKHGNITTADFSKITESARYINDSPIWINDTPNIPLLDLKSQTRKMKRMGIKIVFIDYLTLIKHGDPRMPRYERVGEISKSLKALARELNIPIVVMSQLNRQSEGAKPSLADLRQSGEIEEDSDIIMLIHREDRESEKAELTIAKHRNGPCGKIDFSYFAQYTKFEEVPDEISDRPYAD